MFRLLAGQTQRQIAKDLSLSETWVSLVVNDPLFQKEYQKLIDDIRSKVIDTSAEVQEIINTAAPKAARKIVELTDNGDSRIKLKACESVIDHSDFGKEREMEINRPLILTKQQWMLIEEGLAE